MNREALRQQRLLQAILQPRGAGAVLDGWTQHDPDRVALGLNVYRANAAGLAARALGVAYPTIAQLIGDEAFSSLARDFWRMTPPERGDVGLWGANLAGYIEQQPSLAGEPYLADSARLDWSVHMASRAADIDATSPDGLQHLAVANPERLTLALAAGTQVLSSAWPISLIWQAHWRDDAQRFDDARRALSAKADSPQTVHHALVVREGWAVAVHTLDWPDAFFVQAVLAGRPLTDALDEAGSDFAFTDWLTRAVQSQWLKSIELDAAQAAAQAAD